MLLCLEEKEIPRENIDKSKGQNVIFSVEADGILMLIEEARGDGVYFSLRISFILIEQQNCCLRGFVSEDVLLEGHQAANEGQEGTETMLARPAIVKDGPICETRRKPNVT